MIYLIDFCSFPWWLSWLLPALLGLAAGYLLWARWKSKFEELESKFNSAVSKSAKIEADLKDCMHQKAVLDGDIATANGRVKEMQAKLNAGTGNVDTSAWDKKVSALQSELDAAKASNADWQKRYNSLQADMEAYSQTNQTNMGDIASGFAGAVAGAGLTDSKEDSSDSSNDTSSSITTASTYASLKSTNLQIVEGIGPKMTEVLNAAGIKTWSDLANKSESELREILDSHGDKYKIINPESWALQASHADAGNWTELILLQKQLSTGTDSNIDMTDSKLEKMLAKNDKGGFGKFKQNDLKIVEGIGPKIAELLNNAGINTWAELASTSVERIQEILDEAGPKFGLAKPGTWPQQAQLAADGKWQELASLQDELDGGV